MRPPAIEEILDKDTGDFVAAADILQKFKSHGDYNTLRKSNSIRNKSGNYQYVCSRCNEHLEISCYKIEKGHTFYFKHHRDPDDSKCPIKTGTLLSKAEIERRKYLFRKESKPHIELKDRLASIIKEFLDKNVIKDSKFIMDRLGDDDRRKPDIYFKVGEYEQVFELQLNTTFLSVILERESFYSRNKICLLWIFKEFNPEDFIPIAFKDIYIENHHNAFVFDSDAESASWNQKTLCLKVFYPRFTRNGKEIEKIWETEIININQLVFDIHSKRPYYFDSTTLERLVTEEIKQIVQEEEREQLVERNRKANEEYQKLVAKSKENVEHLAKKIRTQEKNEQSEYIENVKDQVNRFKEYLKTIKENDHDYSSLKYAKACITFPRKQIEIDFNYWLQLDLYYSNGKDLIQSLVRNGKHNNLICFLLENKEIYLKFNEDLTKESTLVTVLKDKDAYLSRIPSLLFYRGYKLRDCDISFLKTKLSLYEFNKRVLIYKYFERCTGLLHFIKAVQSEENFNKLCFIQCAKEGEVKYLGEGIQGLLWLGNLALNQYAKHWKYLIFALEYFGTFKKITTGKVGNFINKLDELKQIPFQRDLSFETLIFMLYPEFKVSLLEHVKHDLPVYVKV